MEVYSEPVQKSNELFGKNTIFGTTLMKTLAVKFTSITTARSSVYLVQMWERKKRGICVDELALVSISRINKTKYIGNIEKIQAESKLNSKKHLFWVSSLLPNHHEMKDSAWLIGFYGNHVRGTYLIGLDIFRLLLTQIFAVLQIQDDVVII